MKRDLYVSSELRARALCVFSHLRGWGKPFSELWDHSRLVIKFQSCVQTCWLDHVVTVSSTIVILAAVLVCAHFCGGGLKIWVAHTHRTSPWVTSDVKKCYKPKEREVLSQTPETKLLTANASLSPSSILYDRSCRQGQRQTRLGSQPDFLRGSTLSYFTSHA